MIGRTIPLVLPVLGGLLLAASGARGAEAPDYPLILGFERFKAETEADRFNAGRLLLSELACTRCHEVDAAIQEHLVPSAPPVLTGVGGRIRPGYILQLLLEPQRAKPGTAMPDMLAALDDAERRSIAQDLTDFLASLGGPVLAQGAMPEAAVIAAGERYYHSVGCVACHEPRIPPVLSGNDDPFAEEIVEAAAPAIPSPTLSHLPGKSTWDVVTAFLLNPHAYRPNSRMPSLNLSHEEAQAIAAYLLAGGGEVEESTVLPDAKAIARGRTHFEQLNCASCHELHVNDTLLTSSLEAPPLSQLFGKADAGCLSPEPAKGLPRYPLSPAQHEALAALLSAPVPTAAPTAAERVEHTLLALNCHACHVRGDRGGPEAGRNPYFTPAIEVDLGDEGRIPPHLTGVGAKLTREWMEAMLTGQGAARPYVATRMPRYAPELVEPLVEYFAEADSGTPLPDTNISGLELHHRNHYGRALMGSGGFSCISCHSLGDHQSLGIPALDLAQLPERITPAWFKGYLLDPASWNSQTRMPAFFHEGRSEILDPLKGNADRQIEAMWIYLKEFDHTRLPEGMEPDTSFELVPTDRPLLLRAFVEGVGTHAITVGFPQQFNFAFDALQVRTALVWFGRYIDAESPRADRFTPFIAPLSEEIYPLPPRPPFARLTSQEAPWPDVEGKAAGYRMRGYRLDDAGVPLFRYTFGPLEIEEMLQPLDGARGYTRRFKFGDSPEGVTFIAAEGPDLERISENQYQTGNGSVLSFRADAAIAPAIISVNGMRQLRIALPAELRNLTLHQEWNP